LSSGSLATLLYERFQQAGDLALLHEAIKLEREALALLHPGHPDQEIVSLNLAASLHELYRQGGGVALLDEAIQLKRKALALHPLGDPRQVYSYASLASSLNERYRENGDAALLDEAIELQRKALALPLRPGHPDRAIGFATLAGSLSMSYEQTGNIVLLDEAIEACRYASKHSSASKAWYPLTRLCVLHLHRNSPHYSASKALEYLQQSFQHQAHDTHTFISTVCSNVLLVWDNPSGWTPHTTALLVAVYAQVVDQLPLMANFVLDTSPRLQSLKVCRQIGSDACVAALLAEQPATAVTLIDRAHGVVWGQALRQRDPQMEGAPASLSAELQELLRAIAAPMSADSVGLPDHRDPQDLRYQQNTRIQVILREIRAMPGLAHFMLGSTYETLREAARNHPVVVLVAAHGHAFAMVMQSSVESEPHALRLDLTSDGVLALRVSATQAGLRSRADQRDGNTDGNRDERIQVQISKLNVNHQPLRVLANLWRKIVKPVIDYLQLEVRSDKSIHFPPVDTIQTEGYWSIAASSSLVC
jgi:hypothetical protein